MKFRIFCTPGYKKKTGYYFRVIRDIENLNKLGVNCETTVLNSLSVFIKVCFKTLNSKIKPKFLFENIGAGLVMLPILLFSKIDLSSSILIYHGSLEDLKSFRFYSIKRVIYEMVEKLLIKNNINVIFVSKKMELAYRKKYSNINSVSFFTTPNIPSDEFIKKIYNEESINLNKDKIKDRKVITYCGNCQEWQRIDVLIRFAEKLLNKKNEFYFLFITQDHNVFKNMASEVLSSESYDIVTVDNNLVPLYLKSSDYLYLVRDYNETNLFSCPTKAVEYIYSQKPIIISEGIGDISDFIINQNAGLVVPHASEIDFDIMVEKFLTFDSSYHCESFKNDIYPIGFEPDIIYNVFKEVLKRVN